MRNTLNEWTKTLGKPPLPAMTPTLQRTAELLDEPNSTNTELQQVIDRDPGFALAIFRSFTTASSAAKQDPPHSLAHAISKLGLPTLRRIMQGITPLLGTKHVGNDGLTRCYSRAIHAAHYAREWGRHRDDSNPEEMWLAAMFYSCGEMALWAHAEDKMREIESLVTAGADHNSAAIEILGFSLSQLSLALVREWQLPTLTAAVLEQCWPLKTRQLEVVLAITLARASEHDWGSEQCLDLTDQLAQLQGLSNDHLNSSLHEMAVDVAREMEALPLPVTATQFLTPLKGRLESPNIRLQKIFAQYMTLLRKELGLQRVMFAILSSDRKSLRSRFVMGATEDDPLRLLSIPLGKNDLFAIMLKKPQGLWLNATTRNRYLNMIPNSLHDSIDTRGFFALSLFVDNKPIGMLYADATEPGSLSSERFGLFKRIGFKLSQQLTPGKAE